MEKGFDLEGLKKDIEEHKKVLFFLTLISIGLLSVFIRTRNFDNLDGKLLALDPYLFLRYSRIILEKGSLPARDMMRAWPLGVDTSGPATWLSYTLTYSYQAVKPFFPGLELVTWHNLYPAISSFFIMILIGLIGHEVFENKKIGILAAAFLSVIPAFIYRTTAGFADKEPLATALMFLSLYALIKAYKSKGHIKKLGAFSALAGLASGYMGQIWGGSAFLTLTIGGFFITLFLLGKSNKKDLLILGIYSVINYPLMILPTQALGGFGILKGFKQTLPLAAFCLIGLKEILTILKEKIDLKKLEKVPVTGLTILVLLLVLLFSSLVSPFVSQKVNAAFNKLKSPLKGNVMSTVAEAQQPVFYPDWISQLGWIFLPLLLGSTWLFYKTFEDLEHSKLVSILFLIFLSFFILSNLGRRGTMGAIRRVLGNQHITALFIFLGIFILFIGNAWYNSPEDLKKINNIHLLILVWFMLTIAASRGAMRLFFVLAPPTAIITAYFFEKFAGLIKTFFEKKYRFASYLVAGVIFLLFFTQAHAKVQRIGPSYSPTWERGGEWVKNNTSKNASFIHWWDYGYWVQTKWNRPTVRDGGHPGYSHPLDNFSWYWGESEDYYVAKGIFLAENKSTAYKTLKFFGKPTYFLVISDEIPKFGAMTSIAGHPSTFATLRYQTKNQKPVLYPRERLMRKYPGLSKYKNYSKVAILQPKGYITPKRNITINGKSFSKSDSLVGAVFQLRSNKTGGPILALLYNQREGHAGLIEFQKTCMRKLGCLEKNPEGLSGGIMPLRGGALYIPSYAMGKLFTDLYVLGKGYPGFELAYDSDMGFSMGALTGATDMKIWKLNYTKLAN